MADLLGPRNNDDEDDTIYINGPVKSDRTVNVTTMRRSALKRSAVLNGFFGSDDYQPGCNMTITFKYDPPVAFQVVKMYLEDGPDRLTKKIIEEFVTDRSSSEVDGFENLARLYVLAKKLELTILAVATYDILVGKNHQMTGYSCFKLASLFYNPEEEGCNDGTLKDWLLKQVECHFAELHESDEWNNMLGASHEDLQYKWADLVDKNKKMLETIQEEEEDKYLKKMNEDLEAASRKKAQAEAEKSATKISDKKIFTKKASSKKNSNKKKKASARNTTTDKNASNQVRTFRSFARLIDIMK